MQNKPNFQKTKIAVTLMITMITNYEPQTMNYSKQTQTGVFKATGRKTFQMIKCTYPLSKNIHNEFCMAKGRNV